MRKICCALLALFALAFCLSPALAFAQDVPGISVAEFAGEEAPAIWSILSGYGPLGVLLFGIIGLLYKLLKPMLMSWLTSNGTSARATAIANIYNIVEVGVLAVKQTYVDAIKLARADGKLTVEEAAAAREKVLAFTVDYFKAHGVDIAKQYGLDVINMIIEGVLSKFKADSSIARAVALPLPDLAPSAPSV